MRTRGFPVMIQQGAKRIEAGFRAPATDQPVVVALRLRDRGWDPYRVTFDAEAGAWIAHVLESRSVARQARNSDAA